MFGYIKKCFFIAMKFFNLSNVNQELMKQDT